MAATTVLSPGVPVTITQNVVYGLPTMAVMVHSDSTVEVGMASGTTGFVLLTNANTVGANCAASYIRCTTGNAVIVVKRFQ